MNFPASSFRHPLRIRLVLVAASLLAAALVGTGVASALIMHRNLSEQLEASLVVATDAAIASLDSQVTDVAQLREPNDLLWFYLSGPGSFQLLLGADGTVLSSAYLDGEFASSPLTAEQQRVLITASTSADYVSSITLPGLGTAIAISAPFALSNVEGTFILVNGSTTAAVDATVWEFIGTGILIGGFALLTISIAGYWIIRRSLRPLETVVQLADEVIATPLSIGAITLPGRSAPRIDDRSEAGRVSDALNGLLDHVETALNARHRVEESMRRFIADASHELKNPLASIRGYADHYRKEPDTPRETREALERINSEAARMSQLVNDLLQLTRMEVQPALHPTEIDASRVILEVVADARVAFPHHVWRIEIPEHPVVLDSDDAALRQILLNLTTNAGTHTDSGTVVTVSVTPGTDSVEISVHDNGGGIPESALGHIFEPFTQNSQTPNRRNAESAGLGLTIALRLSRWLGGTLTATSTRADTVFTITLPRRIGDSP